MIMIIGLVLAPVAISNAGLDGASGFEAPIIALITFVTVVIISIYAKGILKIIPFLIAIVVGYISSVLLNVVSLHNVFDGVSFFSLPDFTFVGTYKMNLSAVLMFSPIAFVTIAEHIGNHTVLGQIIGRDLIKDPGLDNTLLGDGIATFVSAAIGGPANTTYGENTGVVAMTKVASVWVTGLAAIIAIILGFFGYIQAFILSIPNGVLGGMTIVLYGLIAANGVKVLVEEKVNLSNMKNLIIVGAMLVIGLGGAAIQLNSSVSLSGMSLAALVGILLTVILNPQKEQTEDINTIKI
jgi:uracil permease